PVKYGLDEALILAQRNGLAVGAELEAADTDVAPLSFRLLFGEPDGGDLRTAVGTAGNFSLVEGMHRGHPRNLLNTDYAFVLGLVGKHRRASDIANGIDPGNVGAAIAVHHHATALGPDAQRLQPQVFDVALSANGRDHAVGSNFFRRAVRSE